MANPFNRDKQEVNYMNWDSGFAAASETDCPYEKDDEETRQYYSAWMKGFKANKTRPAPKASNEDVEGLEAKAIAQGTLTLSDGSLASITTESLEAELRKRKQGELNQLLADKATLMKQLELIENKIFALEVLFGGK